MKLPALPTNLAVMDYLALMQVLFGVGYVISHLLRGDSAADVWLTGYSMAFGGMGTKLAYETVNPKLTRPGQPRINLIDTLTRR